jgi:hypothetical protein
MPKQLCEFRRTRMYFFVAGKSKLLSRIGESRFVSRAPAEIAPTDRIRFESTATMSSANRNHAI